MKNVIHILIAGVCFSLFTYLIWPKDLKYVKIEDRTEEYKVCYELGNESQFIIPVIFATFSTSVLSNGIVGLLTKYWPDNLWKKDDDLAVRTIGTTPGVNIIVVSILMIAIIRDQLSKGTV